MPGGYYDFVRGKRICKLDQEFAQELYDQQKCDREIAAQCGVTVSAVREWRRRNGLEPNLDKQWRGDSRRLHTDPKQCAGCVYWRGANGQRQEMRFCHFLLDTDKRRVVENGVCLSRDTNMREVSM